MAKSVRAVLKDADEAFNIAGIESAKQDARLLLSHITGFSRTDMLTNPHATLTRAQLTQMDELIARRMTQEPIAYILNSQPFWTLDLIVTPATLIPRPETEDVVRYGLNAIVDVAAPRILDIGTGSGAIILSLLSERDEAKGVGTDISAAALAIANQNAQKFDLSSRVDFVKSDVYENVHGQFDLIVSNPPYISAEIIETLDTGVRAFEPRLALDGGADGLGFYRKIAKQAKAYLNAGGTLALEIGYDQGESVCSLLKNYGYSGVIVHKDLAGLDRIVVADR